MSRRQLFFILILNAFVSLAIAVAVVWLAEQRRPDAEELAALYTPEPPVVLIVTPTPAAQSAQPPVVTPAADQPAATAASPAQGGDTSEIYVVQAGDSLLQIALKFGLTMDALLQANNLTNPDFVFVGQRLAIPSGEGSAVPATAGNSTPTASSTPTADGLALRVEQPGNLAQEQVQVVNDSDAAINLQGWTLGREGSPVYTFGNVPIFPGGSVRVHSGNGQSNTINLYWGLSEPAWSSGVVALLRNPEGAVMASVTVP